MLKKTVYLILVLILMFSFAACGGGKESVSSNRQDISSGTGTAHLLTGTSWTAEDESILTLNKDGTFYWYRYPENKEDSYYQGTYKLYNGLAAVKYIANDLSAHGMTFSDQMDIIEEGGNDIDTYYCMVLQNEQCIVEGKNTLTEPSVVPYFGFYYAEQDYLDFVNLNTTVYCGLKKMSE